MRRLNLRLFPHVVPARFLDRPSRFTVQARTGSRPVTAYLPSPGRLEELLLPGARLWLAPACPGPSPRRTRWTAVGAEGPSGPVLLHTGCTNAIARALLERRLVPGLENARLLRQEVPLGRARFDFLLEEKGAPLYLEVKSCTLLEGSGALFPDAVTDRGRRHLEELGRLARRGVGAGLLFVVHHPGARWFLPDWHRDLAFARTFLELAPRLVTVAAVPVRTRDDLTITAACPPLPIPLEALRSEIGDRGAYVLILRVARRVRIAAGALGPVTFPPGHYAYVGSALRGLSARLARHRRLRKRPHWHIDFLRARAEHMGDCAVRSSRRDECALAAGLARLGTRCPPRFGAADCRCGGHLIHFAADPRHLRPYHELLAAFRTRAVEEHLAAGSAATRSGHGAPHAAGQPGSSTHSLPRACSGPRRNR